MAQIRETKCLSINQIKNILTNWKTLFGATSDEIIFEGKPNFSLENIKKWSLPRLTKFADNYVVHKFTIPKRAPLYIITLETNKFDKINIQACIWFYHLFQDDIYKTQTTRPEIYISPAFVVTPAMYNHVPTNILPCMYRFVPLPEVYCMIGSSRMIFGMTWDYRVLDNEEIKGTREYSILFDSDPIIKVLNAIPGDIIEYKRVLCEGSPYTEYYRRKVINTTTDINIIMPSGICLGKANTSTDDHEDELNDNNDEEGDEDDDENKKQTGGKKHRPNKKTVTFTAVKTNPSTKASVKARPRKAIPVSNERIPIRQRKVTIQLPE